MRALLAQKARRGVRFACAAAAVAGLLALTVDAQSPERQLSPEPGQVQTFFLKHVGDVHQLNDVQTALRNLFSRVRIYALASENAISVRGTPEEIAGVQKELAILDRQREMYRVTYTFAEIEAGKRVKAHTVSIVVAANGKGNFKQGMRVPIVTGTVGDTPANQTSQVQYVDVGINLEATIEGPQLRTKIEQTSVAEQKSGLGAQDPMIQQTVLEGYAPLNSGKPVELGSMDVPDSTMQRQISVTSVLLPQQE